MRKQEQMSLFSDLKGYNRLISLKSLLSILSAWHFWWKHFVHNINIGILWYYLMFTFSTYKCLQIYLNFIFKCIIIIQTYFIPPKIIILNYINIIIENEAFLRNIKFFFFGVSSPYKFCGLMKWCFLIIIIYFCSDWSVCWFLRAALHSAEVQLGWTMYPLCPVLHCVVVCVLLHYVLSGVLDLCVSCGGMQWKWLSSSLITGAAGSQYDVHIHLQRSGAHWGKNISG